MNNFKRLKYLLVSIILSVFFFGVIGCKHHPEENTFEEIKKAVVTISIKLDSQVLHLPENSRLAAPALNNEIITYSITAEKLNSNQKPTGEKVTLTNPVESENSLDYTLEITPGQWKITVLGSIEDKIMLKGEDSLLVEQNGRYYKEILVNFISEKYGSIQLQIDVSDTNIDYLRISETNSILDYQQEESQIRQEFFRDENGIITIETEKIPAGAYAPWLSFYSKSDNESENDSLIIQIPENFQVFQNMKTQYWIKSGFSAYLTDSDADGFCDFKITSELITTVTNSMYYVSSPKDSKYPGDDKNNGDTYTAPFKSVQAAINKIISINENNTEEKEYILFVKGTVGSNSEYDFTSPIPSVNINPDKNLKLLVVPYGGTEAEILNELYIGQNAEISIKNIKTSTIHNRGKLISNSCEIKGLKALITEDNFSYTYLSTTTLYDNVEIKENATVIFADSTRFAPTVFLEKNVILEKGAYLQLEDTDTENEYNPAVFARIKSESPEKNLQILKNSDGSNISLAQFARYLLNNPGYYMELSADYKTATIKVSSITIRLPKFEHYTMKLSFTKNGINLSDKAFVEGKIRISKAEAANSIVTIQIFDENQKEIYPKEMEISLLSGTATLITNKTEEDNQNSEKMNILTIPENLEEAIYSLNIKFVPEKNDTIKDGNIILEITK